MKLLHGADLHLDSPFQALSAQEARQRRQGQRQTLEALRDAAQTHQVDLVLLAGDLFDGAQTQPETVTLLAKTLGELPCPVCIAPGNHDYYSDRSPYASVRWPENVHIFSGEDVTSVVLEEKNVEVFGCAFTGPQRESDPLKGFTAPEDGRIHLGCFHGQVGTEGNGYAPIAPESLRQSGLDYAALGHVHAFSGARTEGKTTWAYSGCAMGRGFDETGDKGYLLVELENGKTNLTFLPAPGPRYEWLTVDVTGQEPRAALERALEGHGEDYCRVTLTGEAQELDLAALRLALAGNCRTLQLRDDTVPPMDIWARAGEENLTGLFLQEMKTRLEKAPEDQRERLNLALRFGLAALEKRDFPETEVRE